MSGARGRRTTPLNVRCKHCGRRLHRANLRGWGIYVWAHERGWGQKCRELRARREAEEQENG